MQILTEKDQAMEYSRFLRSPEPCTTPKCISHVERNVFCKFYDECLDDAIRHNWHGFSCRYCLAHEQIEINEAWVQTDSDKCHGFLLALFHEKMTATHARYVVRILDAEREANAIAESWIYHEGFANNPLECVY